MPTVRNIPGSYRFFFYSFDRNEPEHIHIQREKMLCKFWLNPILAAQNQGFVARELNTIRRLVETNVKIIMEAWNEHCD